MSNIITGIVTHKMPVNSGTSNAGKAFTTQEIVIREDVEEYPNSVCVSFFGDKGTKALSVVNVGDTVVVDLSFKATEGKGGGRWFTNINGYLKSHMAAGSEGNDNGFTPQDFPVFPTAEPITENADNGLKDGLPF